jgi:alkylation response protein AidB-like acyl-CoA dehydrogenase
VDFELSEDQQTIRAAVAELAGKFDDHYWMTKDQRHEFPTEFYDTFAEGGWLGITTPEEYGGHGFGITEASILLDERCQLDAPVDIWHASGDRARVRRTQGPHAAPHRER